MSDQPDDTKRSPGTGEERDCSVGRTLAIVSDAWSFLIIREGFFGARRFETFRAVLDIPRATLSQRLAKLTREGMFKQVPTVAGGKRLEYRLTKKGFDLYPSFIAMIRFGDRWLSGPDGPPLTLIHATCGCDCQPFAACSSCGKELRPRMVGFRDGPGAGRTAIGPERRSRRSSDTNLFMRGRPSSVSRTLQIIGDRWSFLITREAFFGARRFDQLQVELAIAPNILADRLSRLVEKGIFVRRKYQDQPERFEYSLTAMGRDLYPTYVAMLAWGDRWLADGKVPLILTHLECGQDFTPTIVCDKCHKPIEAHAMRYRLRYDALAYGAMPKAAVTESAD